MSNTRTVESNGVLRSWRIVRRVAGCNSCASKRCRYVSKGRPARVGGLGHRSGGCLFLTSRVLTNREHRRRRDAWRKERGHRHHRTSARRCVLMELNLTSTDDVTLIGLRDVTAKVEEAVVFRDHVAFASTNAGTRELEHRRDPRLDFNWISTSGSEAPAGCAGAACSSTLSSVATLDVTRFQLNFCGPAWEQSSSCGHRPVRPVRHKCLRE